MKRVATYFVMAGLFAVGCGGEVDGTPGETEATSTVSSALGGEHRALRRLLFAGDYDLVGIDHPFLAYLALDQSDASIWGLVSGINSEFADWLDNRFDISIQGGISGDRFTVRASFANPDHPRLSYLIQLDGIGTSTKKGPRVERIDITARLTVFFNNDPVREKVATLVATRREEGRPRPRVK